VGPLVEEKALQKVQGLVDDAVGKGATVVCGGNRPDRPGYFYLPTVLSGVPAQAALMTEEIFGPVAPVVPFDTEEEAIRLANDTPWGLAGYLFTQDVDRGFRVGEALEVGMVGLNTGIVSNPAAPFGGIKASGLGREGGRVGIDEFLEYKYMATPRG
jgi:succinate-semialdehyde dehydrogenase / glutarate-semialdehyde dehydrogenase